MNQKPSDLLLSVLEFFGILIPGAILVFLHGDFLLSPFGLSIGKLQTSADWIPVFFISIILGHFLHGFSDLLDKLLERFPAQKTTAYLKAARDQISLPPKVSPSPKTLFYFAFSFIRIHDAVAVAELERQAADYKLFRSLTLLFMIDAPLSALSGSFSLTRLAATLLLLCLVAIRYRQLYNWCYQLAFDLYLQVLAKELTRSKT